ncbi:MAG: hypothetical protein LIO44_03550 [Eubacterium sp.]|nr:hypothetical protein [Eubacterium sp.]
MGKFFKFEKPDKQTAISYLLLFIAAATVIYYMLGPSEGYIHSDCVDTMIWSEATLDSGKLFSDTFNYPCLLPFGSAFFVLPFMAVFGFTMFAYRLAMLCFMIVLAIGIYFTARGLGWSKAYSRGAVCLEFIIVSSSTKLRELFWEHIIHYSLGAFLSFVLFALAFAFLKHFEAGGCSFKIKSEVGSENKKGLSKYEKYSVILGICLFLWTFFSAFDGVTTLALSSIPAIGAFALVILVDFKYKIISKENLSLFYVFIIITAATVIGMILFNIVSADISTSYGSAYSNIVNSDEWSNNILKFLKQWTSLLGADYETGAAVTSGKNILAAIKMAGSLVLFLTPVAALFMFPKINRNERIFTIFHWLMSGFVLYGYIFGNLSSVNWRLSPIVCSAVITDMIVWKAVWSAFDIKRGAVLLASLIAASSVITVCQIWSMPFNYGRNNDLHLAAELLEYNGLDYGYATYWNANILTLLSDGKVKVRDITIDDTEPKAGWLNCDKTWYEDQPGRDTYFVLLTESEYEDLSERNHVLLNNPKEIISESNWVVIVKDENIF